LPRRWLKKRLPKKDFPKNTFAHSIFGEKLFHRELWHISRRSLAGGLALGLFLAFTPTVPFHMVLAAVGAIFLRVNLPVAVLSCWINNPFSMFFIYTSALKLGEMLLGDFSMFLPVQGLDGKWDSFFRNASYLWTGSLILGILAALTGYLTVSLMWRYMIVRKWKERKER